MHVPLLLEWVVMCVCLLGLACVVAVSGQSHASVDILLCCFMGVGKRQCLNNSCLAFYTYFSHCLPSD